ncbi:MAG: hypothetical protein AVDCRST_MAG74-2843 [uncultured Pyrinomonadaceae bacterium]|uniref:Uncharacterized protein n=1 Tax=uncultured Pyrinomonadaceae bacterium TaxID=2283094 RepID=A0A6J4PQ49_9BACT|nr:MAG: hypothetical protein AVDCRST_MAG74-2843 [uncultured Pyrinomonadaceae bacterium]
MKKFIALSLLLLSAAAFVPSVEAKSNTASISVEPQYGGQIYQNRRRNNRIVRTYVRNVRQGRAVYRETYRVVYRANGTTRTQLVSRVRIR